MTRRRCGSHGLHTSLTKTQRGYAQERRGIEAYSAIQEREKTTGILTVPVVVHVVYHHANNNVPLERIREQIEILNDCFRARNSDIGSVPDPFKALVGDAEIEFELARRDPFGRPTDGITRTFSSVAIFPSVKPPPSEPLAPYIQDELMAGGTGREAWPRDRYLNVWVCDMDLKLLGFATYPGTATWDDGVVIDVRAFGISSTNCPEFNFGRTLVHEVGHWLNLIHLWGDDDGGCDSSDSVQDTPVQSSWNQGAPTFPSFSCGTENGDLFMNYLDYVHDSVMVMFTKGQCARMRATLLGPRRSIVGCWALSDPIPGLVPESDTGSRKIELERETIEKLARLKGLDSVEKIYDGVGWFSTKSG